ncbi:methionine ABC transporter ATP-binding protein [Helicobacter himalayensis]|uniref:methionine ABC transporter ATP-binding protein n=1 Tax=Helicobacter himalayensis TaxID=1591088 RepID=UPI003D6F3258
MISLQQVTKTYPNGFCAIKGIDLEVQEGDIMGIIGYSGAGKSTLIRLINRLEEPSSGRVEIDGIDMLALSQKQLQKQRQNIGMIFQHFNLLSARDVFGNVAFALEIAKWKKESIKARVDELLELVGLSEKAHFYPSQLSGGQKQRVAIARALANHPKVLLCDEATSALDTKTTRSILSLLKDIQAKLSLTIVLITHQIEVVQQICNKVCVISNGEIVERGKVEEVFANPKEAITRELISFLPLDESKLIAHVGASENTYRVIFTGPNAQSPLISQMIKKFDVDVNILSGSIEEFNKQDIGHLVVKFLQKDTDSIHKSLEWLQSQGVTIESLSSQSLNLKQDSQITQNPHTTQNKD